DVQCRFAKIQGTIGADGECAGAVDCEYATAGHAPTLPSDIPREADHAAGAENAEVAAESVLELRPAGYCKRAAAQGKRVVRVQSQDRIAAGRVCDNGVGIDADEDIVQRIRQPVRIPVGGIAPIAAFWIDPDNASGSDREIADYVGSAELIAGPVCDL